MRKLKKVIPVVLLSLIFIWQNERSYSSDPSNPDYNQIKRFLDKIVPSSSAVYSGNMQSPADSNVEIQVRFKINRPERFFRHPSFGYLAYSEKSILAYNYPNQGTRKVFIGGLIMQVDDQSKIRLSMVEATVGMYKQGALVYSSYVREPVTIFQIIDYSVGNFNALPAKNGNELLETMITMSLQN